jgi:hypothetical protein
MLIAGMKVQLMLDTLLEVHLDPGLFTVVITNMSL